MGLDMYLEGRTFNWTDWNNPENNPMRDGYKIKGITLELGYWRKHPDLHGYIVQTFAKGVDECQDIYLSADNIRQIIRDIRAKKLPHTEGFFFGSSDGSEDAESIEIFEKALAWLERATPPKEPERMGVGGILALAMNRRVVPRYQPEDFVTARESRDVVYRASW